MYRSSLTQLTERSRPQSVLTRKREWTTSYLQALFRMQVIGKYGLKSKREVWRVQMTLAKIRKAARELLTLEPLDPRRIFEGAALLKRMFKFGLLNEGENKLDYVLGLTTARFMDRRLQTVVYKKGFARSVHHARIMIRQRHIRVGKSLVNVPSFLVQVDSEKDIDFASTSPFGGGRPGRNKRRHAKNKKGQEEE